MTTSTLRTYPVGGQLDPAWLASAIPWTHVRATAILSRPDGGAPVVDPTNGAHEHPLTVVNTLTAAVADGQWATAPLKPTTSTGADLALAPSGLTWEITVEIKRGATWHEVISYTVAPSGDRDYDGEGELITVDGDDCIDINALIPPPAAIPPGELFSDAVVEVLIQALTDNPAAIATNLSVTRDDTTVTVASSTGTDATLPAATTSLAGQLTAADKAKLDAITGTNTGDQTATTVAVTPSGSLASTTVQAALTELQGDINGLTSKTAGIASGASTHVTAQSAAELRGFSWPKVATVAALPTTGVTAGEIRTVTANNVNYQWNGTRWLPMAARFGAESTAGAADFNHATNATHGSGAVLLQGTAANAPVSSAGIYWHTFNFEYGNSTGSGNLTQLAIPYANSLSVAAGIWMRGRFSGTWTSWVRVDPIDKGRGFTVFNVKDYGATGDGVTNDEPAITAARAAAAAAEAPVFFPRPSVTYRHVGDMVLEPYEMLIGTLGRGSPLTTATITFPSGGIVAATGIKIQDLYWKGSGGSTIGLSAGNNTTAAVRATLSNCRITGFGTGVKFQNAWIWHLDNCDISHNTGNGIRFDTLTFQINVAGGMIEHNGGYGVEHFSGSKHVLSGVTIEGNTLGGVIVPELDNLALAGQRKSSIVYDNCYFEGSGALNHISILGRNTVGFSIKDCTFAGCDYGIYIDPSPGGTFPVFGYAPGCSHVRILGCFGHGGDPNPGTLLYIGENAENTVVGISHIPPDGVYGAGSAASVNYAYDPATHDHGINTIHVEDPFPRATADLPASAMIGTCIFNTTLGAPVWWDGTDWVDATGTPI